MSDFISFKRGECPVCSGIKKGCRESTTSKMVFCRSSDANPSGYIFRGFDRWDFGLWQPSEAAEAFAQKSKEEQQQEQQQRRVENEHRRQQQITTQLPAVERDRYYRKILEQLPLREGDREDLQNRGFSAEQIKADGYASVEQWQEVLGAFPPNLPGLLSNGKLNSQPGYVFPVEDVNGLIVALSIRLRDGENGRYRWLTSATKKNPEGATPHLDGELPITVFEPTENQGDSIWLTEGVGIKPSLTRYRLGVPVVGASSGLFSSSPNTCQATLEKLSAKYQTKNLIIAVDAGDVKNAHVCQRWKGEFEFLQSLGYEVKIAWWGQVDKTYPDIDELEDFSTIQYISPSEFFNLGQPSTTPQGFSSSNDTPEWKNGEFAKWRNWRELTGATQINQQYIDVGLPQDNSVIAIKSGTGTAKTTQLRKWVSEWRSTESNPNYLCPGYRNSLLRQLAEILGIQHIHESDIRVMSREPGSGVAFCIQSLIKMASMEGESYADKIVILDEAMSTLRDLLVGKTVRNRTKVIEGFKRMVCEARIVIIMDATLANWGLELIKSFAPDKSVIAIENLYKGDKGRLNFLLGTMTEEVDKIKKNDRSPYFQLALEAPHPLICSDSQIFLEALDRILAATGKKVMRVDSKTIGNPEVKEFLKDSNACILLYKPQSLLYSPTAESGLDVSVKNYFSHHFGFFFGVQSVDAIIQMMGRLRDPNCEKYVWIKERVNVTENATAKSIKDLILSDISTTLSSEETLEVVIEKLQQLSNQAKGLEFDTAIQINEMANFERANLRACAREAFIEAGYEVINRMLDGNPKQTEKEKVVKEEVKVETSKLIFKAEQIPVEGEDDWKELETLKMSDNLEDRWKLENAFLRKRLPGIETTEVWTPEFIKLTKFDDRDFISHAEMFWLMQNTDVAKSQTTKRLCELSQKEKIFLPDYRSPWAKIHAMKSIGVDKFITEGAEWNENSPELKELVKLAPKHENELGVKLTSEKGRNIKYLTKLLGKLGIKLKASGKRDGVKRSRTYQIDSESFNSPPRRTTLACIELKWGDKELAKTELENAKNSALELLGGKVPQMQSEYTVEVCPLVGNIVYTNEKQWASNLREESQGDIQVLGAAVVQKSEIESLLECFPFCDSADEFTSIIEGSPLEAVEDAIALSGDQPRRKQLEMWLEAVQKPAVQDSVVSPIKISGKALRGNKHSYIGQIAQILKTCKNYYETSLGSIPRIEVERGNWSFV